MAQYNISSYFSFITISVKIAVFTSVGLDINRRNLTFKPPDTHAKSFCWYQAVGDTQKNTGATALVRITLQSRSDKKETVSFQPCREAFLHFRNDFFSCFLLPPWLLLLMLRIMAISQNVSAERLCCKRIKLGLDRWAVQALLINSLIRLSRIY